MQIIRKKVPNINSSMYFEYGYLMLPLDLRIVSSIKIGKEHYFSKTGYHVSLLNLGDYSKSEQEQIFNIAKKFPIKLNEITNIYRLVKDGSRKSIIVRVRLRGLRKIITSLNNTFGYNFVYPPTHVTLFTLRGMVGGIGVDSVSEYKHLTYPISQKDSARLTKTFKLK